MRILKGKIAAIFLTAIFALFGALFGVATMQRVEAFAASSKVDIALADLTCTEFAQFSLYEDTHRTRLIVQEGGDEWGAVSVNREQAAWLDHITVNGKSVTQHKSEYEANGSPALNTSDKYISKYGCTPISVTFTRDTAINANVIDISIPEAYIPATELMEIGIAGPIVHVYEGDNICTYTLSGELTVKNPNAALPTYTVCIDGVCQEVEEGRLAIQPQIPTKEETQSHTFEFVGWYYVDGNGEKAYWDFLTDVVTGDVTLLSEFKAVEKTKYTVTFDPDNGEEKTVIEVYEGALISVEKIPSDPEKAETSERVYLFEGWFNADTGASFDVDMPVCANVDVIAKFMFIVKYSVTIDGVTQTVLAGERLQEPTSTPTKEETESHVYRFVGWYYIEEGQKLYWNFQTDTVSSALVLKADFEEVEKQKYTVTFDTDNGIEPTQIQVYEGGYIKSEQIPGDPQKLQNGHTVYAFYCWSQDGNVAWDFTRDKVTGNITLKAYYTTKTVYTVSLDGVAKIYEEGELVERPADPVKASTDEYDYAFDGWYYLRGETPVLWDFEKNTVTEDVALVPKFLQSKARYSFTLYAEEGQMLSARSLEWGSTLPYPTLANKAWYEFLGWVDGNGNSAPTVMPKHDVVAYANWGKAEYVATVDCEDRVLYTQTYTLDTAEETLATLKEFLLQANDEKYSYAWEKQLPQDLPAEDCSFSALATKLSYKLTVIGDPSNAAQTTEEFVLNWGEELDLQAPSPLRGKEFVGWKTESGVAPGVMPTKNLTVYGEWKWSVYSLTVIDGNGEKQTISYTVKEADDPLYVQATFAQFVISENPKAYTYGWMETPPQTLPLESGNVYTVVKTAIEYTLSFANAEGVLPISFTVATLQDLHLPEPPSKMGYTVKWDKTVAEIGLEDTVFTADYTPIQYKITFLGAEGVKDIFFTVETMQEIRLPSVPERAGYTGKWDKKLSQIGLENATVTAIYTPIGYTLTFVNTNLPSVPFTVETLPLLTFPEVPLKVGYVGAWDKAPSEVRLEDTTVTATYTVLEYTLTFVGLEGVPPIPFTVENISELVFPEIPEKAGYVGNWDKTPAQIGLEDTTVTLTYIPIEYQITFVTFEGSMIIRFDAEDFAYLTFPTIPSRVGYTAEWDKTLSQLKLENATVTAIYTPISYTVTFANVENVPPKTFTIETRGELTFPEPPDKIGYTATWDKTPQMLDLEDTTVTAKYTLVPYTIILQGVEGFDPIVYTVETMSAVRLPVLPERRGYTAKWDKDLSEIGLKNATVTAIYTPISYTITFADTNLPPKQFTVEDLETLILPEVPSKTGYAGAWSKSLSELTLADVTLTATYTPIEYQVEFINAGNVSSIVFTVENLSEVRFPAVPIKEGYVGAWNRTPAQLGLADAKITAVYTPIVYTLSFACEGVSPMTFTVEDRGELQLPAVPERRGYSGVWDKSKEELGLENSTLRPIYTAIVYTITFAGVEEEIAPITFTVETISKIVIPALPTKEGHTGVWNKTAADITLEDTVVTAIYTEIPVLDQIKDYGENVKRSCFGTVSMASALLPLMLTASFLYKRKED